MYLALFLMVILYLYIVREEKTRIYIYAVTAAILIFFPITGMVMEAYFQGFYSALHIQWLLPVFAVIAFGTADVYKRQNVKWKKYMIIPSVCLVILLSGFGTRSYLVTETNDNTEEIAAIYDLILEKSGERQVTLVAPKEIMENARAYDGKLGTAYGRDIWETDLDYAFYGNYEEWAYGLSEHMNESFDENEELILDEIARSGATYVIFYKENLTFNEDMYYPTTLRSDSMTLKRIEETRHYVIYSR